MPSCAIKWCKNYTKVNRKSDGITFHTFPTNIVIRDNWVTAIRLSRKDSQWQPSSSSVVCSDHFEQTDMYDTKRGLRRIHRTGYPKKKLFPPSDVDMIDIFWPNMLPPLVPNMPVMPSVVLDSNLKLPSTFSAAVRVLPDQPERDVDQESIYDTPRKYKLRQKLRKRELILKKNAAKIKILQQKVRRLQKSNSSLKERINNLKFH